MRHGPNLMLHLAPDLWRFQSVRRPREARRPKRGVKNARPGGILQSSDRRGDGNPKTRVEVIPNQEEVERPELGPRSVVHMGWATGWAKKGCSTSLRKMRRFSSKRTTPTRRGFVSLCRRPLARFPRSEPARSFHSKIRPLSISGQVVTGGICLL